MNEIFSLMDDFIIESKEHLNSLQELFLILEKQYENPDPELINKIFRAIHTVKGASGFFGLRNVGELSHIMETILSLMRSGEMKPNPEIIDNLLNGVDILNGLIDDVHNSDTRDISDKLTIFNNMLMENDNSREKISPSSYVSLTDIEKKLSFSFRQSTLQNIPAAHEFLYVLKYDLNSLKRNMALVLKNLFITSMK